ncbi:MAG: hypothetical protein CL843_03565 [Crocinitomicaceae bacterium]|nr:hypothetical protein [Crocinitomicaceae bacterium]
MCCSCLMMGTRVWLLLQNMHEQENSSYIFQQDSASAIPFYLKQPEAEALLYKPFYDGEAVVAQQVRPSYDGALREKPLVGSLFIALVAIIAGYILVGNGNTRYYSEMIQSLFSSRVTRQMIREENYMNTYVTFFMLLMAFFINAIFFYQLAMLWPINFSEYSQLDAWLVIVGLSLFFALWFALKVILLFFSGILFKKRNEMMEYLATLFNYTQISGLILLPVITTVQYFDLPPVFTSKAGAIDFSIVFVIIGLVFVGVLYAYRLIKTIYFGTFIYSLSPVYNILYLCALEILPLFILARWLVNHLVVW